MQKGSWVCWETFTAAPLSVLLLSFQGDPSATLGEIVCYL
jgi:hypothetical protein